MASLDLSLRTHGVLMEADISESGSSLQSQPSSEQNAPADVQRREALIKLGKYTAYATPILLATVTVAQAASGTPSPPVS
jgi:hypothetical protein